MASILRVNVAECSISPQALHFCPPDQPGRGCRGGWTLSSTLSLLQQVGRELPTAACVPYRPDVTGESEDSCTASCDAPSKHAAEGQFTSKQITTAWQAQEHIRRYGAVITRFDIMDDFKLFYENYANKEAVYKPKPGAKFVQGHAVLLVGYDNNKQYWIAKNSWGNGWADDGYFKVAYGVCSVLTTEKGEAYGVVWKPKDWPKSARLPLTAWPFVPGKCPDYWARAGDYISKIAWLAGIPLQEFMLDNVNKVTDLDAPIDRITFKICKPKPGRTVVTGTMGNPRYPEGSGWLP